MSRPRYMPARYSSIAATATAAWLFVCAARAQGVPETREYSRRGELSVGAEAPSPSEMVVAITRGSPEKLKATLEYGERVYCAECVPLLEERLLASAEPRVRELSAWWLRRQPFAAPAISRRLKQRVHDGPTPVLRARAAEALGELMDPHALEPLSLAARSDADPAVRAAAVRALARLNEPSASAVLGLALGDPDPAVRAAALEVVIVARGFREHGALLLRLGDPEPALRAHAARLCGELRLAAAEPTLVAMLRGDAAASARKAAAWALGRIGGAEGRAALATQRPLEQDPLVLSAIAIAERMPVRGP